MALSGGADSKLMKGRRVFKITTAMVSAGVVDLETTGAGEAGVQWFYWWVLLVR